MKLFLEVRMYDEYGKTHGVIREELSPDMAFMGQRAVDEARAGLAQLNDVVRLMHVRELRHTALQQECSRLGACLSYFLQDREGWHGIDRQESKEEVLKKLGLN